jgi:hypothetical protein
MELRIRLDEAHRHVEVEFWVGDALVGQVRLAAADLDEHLRTMAALRAQMTDTVPETLEPNARLLTERDPKWVLGQNPVQDRFLLALRHAGLGWLGFALPGDEARAIADMVRKSGSEPEA